MAWFTHHATQRMSEAVTSVINPRQTGGSGAGTYGVQAAKGRVQGSVGSLHADDGPLGVGRVVSGQRLMVGEAGMAAGVALCR